jgi:hypothetical protein
MKPFKMNKSFGINSQNQIEQSKEKGFRGVVACLETFYYSFNNRDLKTFKKIWLNDKLIQLNNPLGGIIRGINPITVLYNRIFSGKARVWVEFSDIVCYPSDNMVVFAGRETGEFTTEDGQTIALQIRTTRFFSYSNKDNQWFQVHHHGSIDDAGLLERYQKAVKK